MMTALGMLREGIERGVGNCNEAARRLNVTPSMLSKVLSGERNLAPDLKPRVAKMHPLAGLAIALEATGYSWFSYVDGDRHPQTMIRRVEKEDVEADEALKPIAWRTIDKQLAEDLTPEDVVALKAAAKEISDRIIAEINLLIEWEDRYKLGLLDMLRQKEKAALAAAR
ncbi:MAG TPA: hypothetical protein PK728_09780 [Bacillota bacterium]|nr:hypothetical protein [Bacillota bacterium]